MGDKRLRLISETVGAPPFVNYFLSRLYVDDILSRHLPPSASLPASKDCLLVLFRNLVLGRAPIYGLGEWAVPFRPSLLGLTIPQVGRLNGDHVERPEFGSLDTTQLTGYVGTTPHDLNSLS